MWKGGGDKGGGVVKRRRRAAKTRRRGFCRPSPPLYLPPLYLPPLLHDNHLLRKSAPINNQLIDVDARRGWIPRVEHIAVPVRGKRARRRSYSSARQLEIHQCLAIALKNRHGDQLRQHVIDLERHPRPMTIGKQITVQRERDRGRRIKRVRVVLFELDQRRRRRLPQHSIDSRQSLPPEHPHQHCPGVQLHLTDSSANGKDALDSSPCRYRAQELNTVEQKLGTAEPLSST